MGAYVSNKQLFLFKHSNNKLTLYKDRSKLIETALKNKSISDIVFNNKNNLIVTADNEILFFDSRTGKLIKKIIHDTPMSTTRTTYHGEILSYDKANNELMYWDQDHTLLERFKNPHFEDDFTWRNFQFDPQYGHVIFYTNKEAYFYNMKSNFDKLSSVKKTNEYIKINYLLTFPAQLEIKLLNKKKKTIASCIHEKRNIHRRLNSNSNLSIIPSGKNKALCKLNNNKNQTLAFIQFTGKSFYSNPDKIKKIIPIKTKNR